MEIPIETYDKETTLISNACDFPDFVENFLKILLGVRKTRFLVNSLGFLHELYLFNV